MAFLQFQARATFNRLTLAEWTSENPVIREGEIVLETDTNKVKIGDGVSTYTELQYVVSPSEVNILTKTSSYTLSAPDMHNTMIVFDSSSSMTLTIPTDALIGSNVGSIVAFLQLGVGQLTISGAGGVTVVSSGTTKSRTQYSAVSITKIDANKWFVSGDLEQ